MLPPRQLSIREQLIADSTVSLLRAGRHVGRPHILLDPVYHRRLVFVFVVCRRNVPHLATYLSHIERLFLDQTSVDLLLDQSDDGGQPFIQHVRIIAIGIILHGITDQPALAHAHTRVYIIRFAIDRNTNLNRPFIALLGPFSMVIY